MLQKLDITIAPEDLLNGVKTVLSLVRPQWTLEDVTFKVFTEGISNQLMGCFYPSEPPGLLFRVYGAGTELFIDRGAEQRTMRALAEAGQGPDLIATFSNGLVYHFVPGSVLNTETIRLRQNLPLVAKRLAAMHKLPSLDAPVLWARINNFIDLLNEEIFENSKYSSVSSMFPSKSALCSEVEWVRSQLEKSPSPVVFCHNDLLLANIILNPACDDVTFIDYEYSGPNYQAFDIANHFNEWAGVDNIEFDRIPSYDLQTAWIADYLSSYTEDEPSQEELQRTCAQILTLDTPFGVQHHHLEHLLDHGEFLLK